jgi:predicted SAM-dependent methyltransferase
MASKLYVQYGCGLSAPEGWVNFDASPTLRLQKTPLLGMLIKGRLKAIFPDEVRYGDITKGLPGIRDNSCDAVYCSHVLEHLSLEDFHKALHNTYRMLKPGGIFRLVMPDLEKCVEFYTHARAKGERDASLRFMENTILGTEQRPKGLKAIAETVFGNARHLWMWDHQGVIEALEKAGFSSVRKCSYHDSKEEMFHLVEAESRFVHAVALEAIK